MRMATALTVILGLTASLWAGEPGKFLDDWRAARKEANQDKEHPKVIFIHFYEDSSTYCKALEQKTLSDKTVQKELQDFVCVKLDCTEPEKGDVPQSVRTNSNLFRKLGGQGYPFLVMVTSDGVVLGSVDEYVEPKTLLKAIEDAKKGREEYAKFKKLTADAKDYNYQLEALRFYQKYRHTEKAEDAAKKILELDPDNAKGDHVVARLVLLQFSLEDSDKTEPMMDEVIKLDPLNEKGAYEKAVLLQMYNEYYDFRMKRRDEPTEAKACLRAIIQRAEKARDIEHRLKDPAKLYYMASQASVQLIQLDKATLWTQRALAVTKDPDEKRILSQRLDQIQELKKKLDSESKPTSNGKQTN